MRLDSTNMVNHLFSPTEIGDGVFCDVLSHEGKGQMIKLILPHDSSLSIQRDSWRSAAL